MLDPNRWPSLTASNVIVGGKALETKGGYTNESAVEKRVVDAELEVTQTEELTRIVQSVTVEEEKVVVVEERKETATTAAKLVPPKHSCAPNILGDSDHEGEEEGESVKESSSSSSSSSSGEESDDN